MMIKKLIGAVCLVATLGLISVESARAESAEEIDAKVNIALNTLLEDSEAAQAIDEKAIATLVFPDIIKAGLGVGGQYGEGALRRDGATVGYYNIASASFGFQAGAQTYSQVLYFMTEEALETFRKARGFELGADANVAVLSEGAGIDVSTATALDPIVAFVFGQQGLMGGVTLEGSKISKITPK